MAIGRKKRRGNRRPSHKYMVGFALARDRVRSWVQRVFGRRHKTTSRYRRGIDRFPANNFLFNRSDENGATRP